MDTASFQDVTREMLELAKKKNHDYGPDNIISLGPKGVFVRKEMIIKKSLLLILLFSFFNYWGQTAYADTAPVIDQAEQIKVDASGFGTNIPDTVTSVQEALDEIDDLVFAGTGTMAGVQEAGVQVGDLDITTLNFGAGFDLSESPDKYINISLDLSEVSGYNKTNWDSAYGWGDHSAAGYLTSYSESDPVFISSPAYGISAGEISSWNTAYGWGNHASVGYLTSYVETDPVFSAWDKDYNDLINKPTIPTNLSALVDDIGVSADWDEFSDLPVAAVTNDDTTHIPSCDAVYDFVVAFGYLTGESDTLATVTGRGATTTVNVTVGPTLNVGDGDDETIYFYANNGDENKPAVRYNHSTNQWEYSNDGVTFVAIGSGSGSDTFRIYDLKPMSAKLSGGDITNPALIEGGDRDWKIYFDDTTEQEITYQFVVPSNYDGQNFSVDLIFSVLSTQTGDTNVKFEAKFMCVTPNIDSEDFNSDGYAAAQTVTHALATDQPAGYQRKASISFTQAQADSMAAGDICRLHIKRNTSVSGDATGHVELTGILIEED